jgi:uncharacterized protein (DUF362 family)
MWDSVYPYPKFGVLTTSLLVEEMVRLLKSYGYNNITIGEGSIVDRAFGSDTKAAFAGLGYHVLRDRYGVQLVDFNDGPFERVDFDGYQLDISSHVLETDFLVNMPVLKTHSNTKVSLGLKNLKGCLHTRSKMFCHHTELPLDGFVSRLAPAIQPALTVIDGIYALEKGPVVNGRAYRNNLIIASTDPFAADAVGAKVLGFEPSEIDHIREYGQMQGLSFDDVDVIGEKIEDVALPLSWDWTWLPDGSGPEAFGRLGMAGVYFPKYDNTICSGCSYLNNYLLVSLIGAYAQQPFSGMEFLGGKNCRSQGGYNKSFLFGKCAVELNKDNPLITEAVPLPGCPPAKEQILETLNLHGIRANDQAYADYRASIFKRYRNKAVFSEEHFQIS